MIKSVAGRRKPYLLSLFCHSTATDLLPALKRRGFLLLRGRFGITFPLLEDSIPGRVSGPLPLSLSGLGVMDKLLIIANCSKYLILITKNN
jgi:hypothetical protein